MYIYNDSEMNLCCDVDDTLVLHRDALKGEETVDIIEELKRNA